MDLKTPLDQVPKIGKTTARKLEKLGLKKVIDLLYHFPFRYDDFSEILTIAQLKERQSGTIKAKIKQISNHKTPYKKLIITEAIVSDQTDSIKVVWFGQPFLTKILKPGQEIFLAGKIDYDKLFGCQLVSPSYEFFKKDGLIHLGRLVPIYPSTEKLSQKQIRFLIKQVLPLAEKIKDFLPEKIKKDYQLMSLPLALEQIHFPASKNLLLKAEHRLKFDELFLIQLQAQLVKEKLKKQRAVKMEIKLEEIKKFIKELPFNLTQAQKKSAWEILKDLEKTSPMNRLLEGDVGSGKTVVATIAILNVVLNHYQVAYLAPMEILARQHFENISKLLKNWPIKIGLLTREETEIKIKNKREKIKKRELLEKMKNGEIDLTIGTHALLQENVSFKKLGLIIVDEQHRFGVEQRARLSTQINADQNADQRGLVYENLTYKIRGILFNVYNKLGPAHKENIYGNALEEEFKKNNIPYEREKTIDIIYDNKKIGIYKPDFIIDNKIILEIKALTSIGKLEEKQMWRYLKGSNYRLALLVNFGTEKLDIKRIIYDIIRDNPRNNLRKSAPEVAHFLSMTATPIPRSLALTLYGDLDLSIIDEMPPGRKKVEIKIVKPEEENEVYNFIRKEINNGRQAFVICPLIDPSDKLGVKSVKQEYEKLSKKIFPDLKLAILHGKLSAKEKDKIMNDFLKNKIKILISTTVVEVGIDVPNVSIILINGAERFGLAQLWQLKGRVGRAQYQSYCFLFSENYSEKVRERLKALLTAKNGFELAEKDLEMRGPGEIFGRQQSGYLQNLKIARFSDTQIIKEAQEAVKKILSFDPELKNFPLLREKIEEITEITHLE